ncbi:MAG TPA: hypothetical protein VF492_05495 [Verrucomicrobiae bacterium]
MKKFIYALAVVLTCGCATEHYKKSQGDVGQFILQQAISYGGSPTTTNNLPVVMRHWRYNEDSYGMQIRMSPNCYSSVETFLNQAFAGARQFGPKVSEDGSGRIHEYRMSPIGGGIQLAGNSTETSVIIIRPKSKL